MRLYWLRGLLGAAIGFAGLAAAAETVTVLDKVYTAAQAERGAADYEAKCASCHEGEEPDATPPKGPEFIDHWREAPLSYLYNHISTNMPGNAPGSLSQAAYVDIVAYLLRENTYPDGGAELTAAKLGGILLVGKDGPKPLPGSALVRVVGCLKSGASDTWTLASATAPMRVRVSDQSSPEEVAQSAAAQAGTANYQLLSAEDFHVSTLKGQRVQAKGSLNQKGNAMTLNVHSLERVGSCE